MIMGDMEMEEAILGILVPKRLLHFPTPYMLKQEKHPYLNSKGTTETVIQIESE
jgi:hypothetical protein